MSEPNYSPESTAKRDIHIPHIVKICLTVAVSFILINQQTKIVAAFGYEDLATSSHISIEGNQVGAPVHLASFLKALRQKTLQTHREIAVSLNSNLQIIQHCQSMGTATTVTLPNPERCSKNVAYMIHTHPARTPFSYADIGYAARYNIEHMIMINAAGEVFQMDNIKAHWSILQPKVTQLKNYLPAIVRQSSHYVSKNRHIPQSDWQAIIDHVQFLVFEDLFMGYYRITNPHTPSAEVQTHARRIYESIQVN